jgi:hypothetical protein
MKKLLLIVLVCVLAGSAAAAQENNNHAILQMFARSAQAEGLTWTFVLLNDRTVDALFQGDGKYAMRARAHMATTFYVQALPDKDMQIDTSFEVEQDGQTFAGTSLNIKNFEKGPAAKGKRIDGIVQLNKKLDLSHPFKIRGAGGSAEFTLTAEALKLSEPVPPPVTPAP